MYTAFVVIYELYNDGLDLHNVRVDLLMITHQIFNVFKIYNRELNILKFSII